MEYPLIIPIPQFTEPSYGDRTLNQVQRCVNWYPEKTSTGWNLISRPGLELLDSTANNSANRGAYVTSTGAVYAANGTSVYEISNSGVDTLIGTITNVAGSTVSWADNGTYCVLVTAGSGYVVNVIAQTMATIVDANFPANANSITYQDGYFIVSANTGDRGQFYLSALNDPMDWTPLTFATAEYSGDPIAQAKSMGSSLYLFGSRSIEVWYNTGNPDFPFERINGSTMNVGTRSTSTFATFGDSMFFLGSNIEGTGAFYQLSGGLKRISNPYIESLVASFTSQGGAYSNCWHHDGHLFFETTFPADSKSLIYDASQGTWWEAASTITGAESYHRVRSIVNRSVAIPTLSFPAFAFDAIDGKVYKVTSGYNTDNTVEIPRIRTFGPIESDTKRVFHSQIRIELEMKFDATGATTISPTLEWSDDGGLTYSTAITMTKTVTNSTTGQRVLLVANRLGSSASRFYRLTLPGAAKFVLKKCELDLKQGRF